MSYSRIVTLVEKDSNEEVIKNSHDDSIILSEEEEVANVDEWKSLMMQRNLSKED